jgi:hypothetical protein
MHGVTPAFSGSIMRQTNLRACECDTSSLGSIWANASISSAAAISVRGAYVAERSEPVSSRASTR